MTAFKHSALMWEARRCSLGALWQRLRHAVLVPPAQLEFFRSMIDWPAHGTIIDIGANFGAKSLSAIERNNWCYIELYARTPGASDHSRA